MRAGENEATACKACGPGEDPGFPPCVTGATDGAEHRRNVILDPGSRITWILPMTV